MSVITQQDDFRKIQIDKTRVGQVGVSGACLWRHACVRAHTVSRPYLAASTLL